MTTYYYYRACKCNFLWTWNTNFQFVLMISESNRGSFHQLSDQWSLISNKYFIITVLYSVAYVREGFGGSSYPPPPKCMVGYGVWHTCVFMKMYLNIHFMRFIQLMFNVYNY